MCRPLVKYSLVIPCYNESDNLSMLVNRCDILLESRKDVEVVLVNNGSTDSTHEVLRDLLSSSIQINYQVVHIRKNKGYGFGVISGLKACNGDVIGWTHADLQTDPVDFLEAICFFEKESDPTNVFVKGSRIDRNFKDEIFTWGMSLFERLVLGVYMKDINAQPTVFSRKFFTSLGNVPNDFSLDLFVFHEAICNGIKIERFPVNFGFRLKGKGHNETLLSKLKYSYKTMVYSVELKIKLKQSRQ